MQLDSFKATGLQLLKEVSGTLVLLHKFLPIEERKKEEVTGHSKERQGQRVDC
jgi:hypothetical protein